MISTLLPVLVGTFCISRIEMFSRTQDTFLLFGIHALPYILVAQFCLYTIFNKASDMMTAWITWTIAMAVIRVLNSHYVLQEGLDLRWTIAGVSLMVGASLCIKQA